MSESVSSLRLMRRDLRNVRSFLVNGPSASSLTDSLGWLASVLTSLRPMVASSMRRTSKPCSRMFLTTPAMSSDSETDSWIASPSFWIRFLTFWFNATSGLPYGSNSHRASGIPGEGDRRERHCGYIGRTWLLLKQYAQGREGCND